MHFSIDYFSATPGYLVTDVASSSAISHVPTRSSQESLEFGLPAPHLPAALALSPSLLAACIVRAQFELSNFPPPPRRHYDSVCLHCSNPTLTHVFCQKLPFLRMREWAFQGQGYNSNLRRLVNYYFLEITLLSDRVCCLKKYDRISY